METDASAGVERIKRRPRWAVFLLDGATPAAGRDGVGAGSLGSGGIFFGGGCGGDAGCGFAFGSGKSTVVELTDGLEAGVTEAVRGTCLERSA